MKSTQATTKKKQEQTIQPLSPAAARQHLRELSWIYEHTETTTDSYDAARKRVFEALAQWGSNNE
jgi:hypothetical protein